MSECTTVVETPALASWPPRGALLGKKGRRAALLRGGRERVRVSFGEGLGTDSGFPGLGAPQKRASKHVVAALPSPARNGRNKWQH
eukprot:4586890-Alexandrium_andersonii.AAC.1